MPKALYAPLTNMDQGSLWERSVHVEREQDLMLRRYVDEVCHKRNLDALEELEELMSADYFVDHAE
jgi:hypothetical protein